VAQKESWQRMFRGDRNEEIRCRVVGLSVVGCRLSVVGWSVVGLIQKIFLCSCSQSNSFLIAKSKFKFLTNETFTLKEVAKMMTTHLHPTMTGSRFWKMGL